MAAPRRRHTVLALSIFITLFLVFRKIWPSAPESPEVLRVTAGKTDTKTNDETIHTDQLSNIYRPGIPKSPGSNYTKTLVIARTKDKDVHWINDELEHLLVDGSLKTAVYVADDPTAPLHPPKNKGNEAMIYLTYIIDHYDDLSEVNLFMHFHQNASHNNELLDNDAVQIILKLSAERVQREGYMNLRCQWSPGCPNWMHPANAHESYWKKEEVTIAKSWPELFPLDSLPEILAQPCCAQFAVSGDRIRSIPLARFIFYRDWLLDTTLSDYLSGRVFEYLWQFIFTGNHVSCPAENICYCDGYGVCFGGEEEYKEWWELWEQKRLAHEELKVWNQQTLEIQHAMKANNLDEISKLEIPEVGKDVQLEKEIEILENQMDEKKKTAIEAGRNPKNRAIEAGRQWHEGDGF